MGCKCEAIESAECFDGKVINLTPHDINVYDNDKEVAVIPSSGVVRCEEYTVLVGFHELENGFNVPLVEKTLKAPIDLSVFNDKSVAYIVSQPILDWAIRNEFDKDVCLLVPYDMVRDEGGKIIGCRGFSC
jgi:hypothetical protein